MLTRQLEAADRGDIDRVDRPRGGGVDLTTHVPLTGPIAPAPDSVPPTDICTTGGVQ